MTMKIRIALMTCGAAFAASISARAADMSRMMRPGNWEITSVMEMPGMPMKPRPFTTTHCVKPEDVKDPENMIKKSEAREQDRNCKMTNFKITENTVRWELNCSGDRAMTGTGEMKYSGDSYEGTFHMNMKGEDSGMREMTMHITGKRLGDCP